MKQKDTSFYNLLFSSWKEMQWWMEHKWKGGEGNTFSAYNLGLNTVFNLMFYKTKSFPKICFYQPISSTSKSKENCIIKFAGFGVVNFLHGG